MLVMISAKKKCLKRTNPKGDIIIFQSVYPKATRPFLYMKWRGFKNIKAKMQSTPRVKAAIAFSNKNSSLMIKV
jgi:hypothetical protein